MLYRYGLKLGVDLSLAGNFRYAAKYLIKPVNYWRNLEYKLVFEEGDFKSTDNVLDIGSPKLLSLYLAEKVGAEVVSTDIEDYFVKEYDAITNLRRIPQSRFQSRVADGRALAFDDGAFNKIYSISVVEHIPDEGDSECMKEMGRVVSSGGRCVVTVPFAPTSRDEYRKADFYWSESSKADSNGMVFFQRRYSEDDLYSRLIEPSGLKLKKLAYFGDRVDIGEHREISDYLPNITGPIQPLLSTIFHCKPRESWQDLKKPLGALLVLEK